MSLYVVSFSGLGPVGAQARNEPSRLQASSKIENSVVTTGSKRGPKGRDRGGSMAGKGHDARDGRGRSETEANKPLFLCNEWQW
jgi:hypothetical protein